MRLLPLLALLSACGPDFYTDDGQLGISLGELVDAAADGEPNAVLAGSEAAVSLECAAEGCESPVSGIEQCFEQRVEGPGTVGGGRISFDAAGTVTWLFTAVPCALTDGGLVLTDDQVTLEVVDAADVSGALPRIYEEVGEDYAAEGALRLEAPEGWVPGEGEPTFVLADHDVPVFPRLRTHEGAQVAWNLAGAAVTVADIVEEPPIVLLDGSTATVRAAAGAGATLTLHVAEADFPVGQVVGVAPDDVVALDVAVAYAPIATGGDAPLLARAIAWDADGRPVFGVPVTWSAEPDMVLDPDPTMPDYALVGDDCRPPSEVYGEQTAALTVSWGEISATETLTWTPRTSPGDDTEWTASTSCVTSAGGEEAGKPTDEEAPEGCGCASGPGLPGALAVALGALAIRRRGRVMLRKTALEGARQ